MEAYQSSRYGSISYELPRQPIIDRESYKVNKVALGILLCLGIVPGVIYLGIIGLLNCLGGRKVTRQQEDFFHVDSQFQSPQRVRRQTASKGSPVKQKVRTNHVDRVRTHSGTQQSAIPQQQRKKTKYRPPLKSIREESPETLHRGSTTHAVDSAIPAPIKERREPRGREEEVAVNIYMGTQVINMSKFNDESERPERIFRMKNLEKSLPYSKTGLPGTFQGFLKYMYNNSYEALYPHK